MSERRRELASRALAMRADGATALEIATTLSVSRSYASELYSDPTGRRGAERRKRYSRPCPNCGKAMDGSNGFGKHAPKLCTSCHHAEQYAMRRWTRERIVAAIQAWAHAHGRPPTANDWHHADPEGRWPNCVSVYSDTAYGGYPAPFAYWGDAIEAAGFPRPRTGARPGDPHWTPELVITLLREGASSNGVAQSSALNETLGNYARQFFGSWSKACAAAGVKPRGSKAWVRRVVA